MNLIINNIKSCRVCQEIKSLDNFYTSKQNVDGYVNICKPCHSLDRKRYYQNTRQQRLDAVKTYRLNNLEKIKKTSKMYYLNNKENILDKNQKYRETPDGKKKKKASDKSWRKNNKEHKKKLDKNWCLNNPERYKARQRNNHLKREYGINITEYNSMFEKQGGVCAICQKHETRKIKGVVSVLCVDHCHTTLLVRGLLCHRCNVAISYLDDDTDILAAAINYLNGVPR